MNVYKYPTFFKIQELLLLCLGMLFLFQHLDAACDSCLKKLNNFCCERRKEVWINDPQKRICCDFPSNSDNSTTLLAGCPFTGNRATCCKIMENNGIDVRTFNASVAHGIHSITVEQLNLFFKGNVSEKNNIPTTNFNLKSPKTVLSSSTKMSRDPNILTNNMRMLDFILRNNDDTRASYFIMNGLSSLEKLAHHAHMDELYARTKPVYEQLLKNPPKDRRVCDCVTDEKNNGVLGKLEWYSNYFRANGDLEKLTSLTKAARHFDPNGYSGYNYIFGQTSFDLHPKPLPRLNSPEAWKKWKSALRIAMLTSKERYNLAMYLYCKLSYCSKACCQGPC